MDTEMKYWNLNGRYQVDNFRGRLMLMSSSCQIFLRRLGRLITECGIMT